MVKLSERRDPSINFFNKPFDDYAQEIAARVGLPLVPFSESGNFVLQAINEEYPGFDLYSLIYKDPELTDELVRQIKELQKIASRKRRKMLSPALQLRPVKNADNGSMIFWHLVLLELPPHGEEVDIEKYTITAYPV